MAKSEEKELKDKKVALAELEEVLATSELERATLFGELMSFQRIYLETVGELIAKLDELEAKVAEALARKQAKNESSARNAAGARKRATESSQAYQEEKKDTHPKIQFNPTPSLKTLFREVAKRIHPDLAKNDEDRLLREDLMKQANEAYRNGNKEMLHAILEEYEARSKSNKREDVRTEIARLIRSIDLAKARIVEIKNEIHQLMSSELFTLKKRFDDAKLENRDFLAEMTIYLHQKIQLAKAELEEIHSRGGK
jgi:pyruvate/2-oxoglutarate dehydrogenase complex dihydrolipoamide acyltransferase (E2) component